MDYNFNIGDRATFIPKDGMPRLVTIVKKEKFIEDWYYDEDTYVYDVKDNNGYSHHVGCGDTILSANSYDECLRSYLGVCERKLELLREQLDNEMAVIKEVNKALNKIGNRGLKEIVW